MKKVVTVFAVLMGILFLAWCQKYLESQLTSESSGTTVQRPAVLVYLSGGTGNEEIDLGARDYLDESAKRNLPGVVAGLNAVCPGFHFYSAVDHPDYVVSFYVRDIDTIGVSASIAGPGTAEDKRIGARRATSIENAFFTACGLLRKSPQLPKEEEHGNE